MTTPLAPRVPLRTVTGPGATGQTPDDTESPGLRMTAPTTLPPTSTTPRSPVRPDDAPAPRPAPDVRVLILARSPAVRAGLAALLTTDSRIAIVQPLAIAGGWLRPGAPDGSRIERAPTPDAVVIDRDSLGTVAVDEATERYPGVPLVLLGGEGESPIRLGECPCAWLGADADGASLVAAVHAVVAGLTVIEPAMAVRLAGAQRPTPSAETGEALTPREQEVLRLVAEGLPNKTIARELGISEHTAKFHVGSLLAKLNAGSRTEAVTTATRRGLLSV
jgi:two-component system, NarL family, nitrate/nitrite response regulator NarL